jgi:predicted RNA-binding Zn-ribbon protein involved in translation (DUF1610 family)
MLMDVACAATMLLAFLVSSVSGYAWVAGCSAAIAFVVGLYTIRSHFYRRRCPQCGERLILRQDYIPGTTRFRCLLDCMRCGVAWDTGHLGDDRAGGGG